MNRDQLEKEWAAFVGLLSFDEVARHVEPIEEFCGEEIQSLLPSNKMGTEGPVIDTIFAFTKNFASEVRTHPGQSQQVHFDLIDRKRTLRLEVKLQQFELPQPEGPPVLLPSATLEVLHGIAGQSTLQFVGDGWKDWLKKAKTHFAPTLLLGR